MGVLDREEIKEFTAEEIAAAIETLQTATGAARDAILKKLNSGGSSGAVKSVQRGTISIASKQASATATIASVDRSKAVVLYSGLTFDTDNDLDNSNWRTFESFAVRLELTSETVVKATRIGTIYSLVVPYQIVEFY